MACTNRTSLAKARDVHIANKFLNSVRSVAFSHQRIHRSLHQQITHKYISLKELQFYVMNLWLTLGPHTVVHENAFVTSSFVLVSLLLPFCVSCCLDGSFPREERVSYSAISRFHVLVS